GGRSGGRRFAEGRATTSVPALRGARTARKTTPLPRTRLSTEIRRVRVPLGSTTPKRSPIFRSRARLMRPSLDIPRSDRLCFGKLAPAGAGGAAGGDAGGGGRSA